MTLGSFEPLHVALGSNEPLQVEVGSIEPLHMATGSNEPLEVVAGASIPDSRGRRLELVSFLQIVLETSWGLLSVVIAGRDGLCWLGTLSLSSFGMSRGSDESSGSLSGVSDTLGSFEPLFMTLGADGTLRSNERGREMDVILLP